MLPEEFLTILTTITPKKKLSQVLKAFETKPVTTFRTNTLVLSSDELKKQLAIDGFEVKQVEWYPDAFFLLNKSVRELTNTDLYKTGCLYIQSLSSMIPSIVLDPHPNDKILDIAAAPGSKTSHIAMLMKNTGEITANDISKNRLFQLRQVLEEQHITNVKVLSLRGEIIWEQLPEYFDRSLVDVPCSMEGRFYANDPKTYKDWTPKKGKQLSSKQQFLLRSAISATKPGGTILYSTCTLAPEENEEVIDWILKKEKNNIKIEKIKLDGVETQTGLTKYKNKTYNDQIKNTVRILRTETMEGFYIAKIKKVNTSTPSSEL